MAWHPDLTLPLPHRPVENGDEIPLYLHWVVGKVMTHFGLEKYIMTFSPTQ